VKGIPGARREETAYANEPCDAGRVSTKNAAREQAENSDEAASETYEPGGGIDNITSSSVDLAGSPPLDDVELPTPPFDNLKDAVLPVVDAGTAVEHAVTHAWGKSANRVRHDAILRDEVSLAAGPGCALVRQVSHHARKRG
jgi:hypothetical protein